MGTPQPSFQVKSGRRALSGPEAVRELLATQPAAHALLQPFYFDQEIYRLDIEHVLARTWHCVGHQSQIPKPGDYLTFECDRDSAIIVRGDDNQIRALANVCRHRGSRICSEKSGHSKILLCPYHAWSYKLDGSLRRIPKQPDGFDQSSHGLKVLQLRVIAGLLFLSFSPDALPLDLAEKTLQESLGVSGWVDAKVVRQERFLLKANWKLALENQVECYHCAPSHVEFTKVHAQGSLGSETPGALLTIYDSWAKQSAPGQELTFWSDNALVAGKVTGSQDGQPVGPLMSSARSFDGHFRIAYLGVLNHFLGYADYGAIFKYTPRSIGETELAVTWLVKGDAREGTDYDVERLTWMWRVTAAADVRIVQENQLGVSSRNYVPGPYILPIEGKVLRFISWYLDELRQATAAG